MGAPMNPDELLKLNRYSRQVLFAPLGWAGQAKLLQAKAVIVGCGALGTAQANLLARAGVGALRLVDRDYVEETNLHRQSLFEESDAAQRFPKAVAAEKALKRVNSSIHVEGIVADVNSRNVEDFIAGFDLVLDGTDNFETRYLLNDAAVKLNIPWIYGAVVASVGVTFTVLPGRTACLSCIFPLPPEGIHETCDTAGVIAPAVSWVTAIQATEALKILAGREADLHGRLLSIDLWKNHSQSVRPAQNPECATCGQRRFVHLERSSPSQAVLCGRNAVQIRQQHPTPIDLDFLRNRLESFGPVRGNNYLVECRLGNYDLTVFQDGRAIVKGTEDAGLARSLYARYVGS